MIETFSTGHDRVVGLRAVGDVTADDYRTVLVPSIAKAVESGEVRLVFQLDSLSQYDAGALAQDARLGLEYGLGHPRAWKRCAVVTDDGHLATAVHAFAWMMPGHVAVFGADELEAAIGWAAD